MTGKPSSEAVAGSRAGFAALIGAPNAGKSTLTNRLAGAPVSIVTHKAQTTRSHVRGVTDHNGAQIVLVDTPGIFSPKRRLDRAMVDAAWRGAADADETLLLVDARRGVTEPVAAIVDALRKRPASRPPALVLNKVDAARRDGLPPLAQVLNAEGLFAKTFMVSARTGDGARDLLDWLAARMPPGPWLYPADQAADMASDLMAAEITREKLLLNVHEELPHTLSVETTAWEPRADGSLRVEQVIHVRREGHRGIVVGAGGRTLRAVGAAARRDMARLLGRPVHLFLFVKARPNWENDPAHYARWGLDFKA